MTGHCLCGNVTYRAEAEPVVQAVCHCTDCQQQTGTACALVVGVPHDSFTAEGRTVASFTTTGEEHGLNTERQFCSACGSPIVSLAEEDPDLAFLHAGTLDDASWLEPELEIWTRSAQPWSQHVEHAARYERGAD